MADGHADIEQVTALLKQAIDDNASDVFLIPGAPVTFKVGETHQPQGERLTPGMAREHIAAIYMLAKRVPHYDEVPHTDDDFSFAIPGIGRFRLNVYYQRNTLAAVLRVIKFGLPDAAASNIPEEVMRCADLKQGLVLVTGPAGNGKSTTLACIVDKINETRCGHIITVEDPIEFVHNHKKSLVSQREIATDVESYELALASALRENPDVIMFGEMRTRSVIEVAMRAAETGQLMLSSLHTLGSAQPSRGSSTPFPPRSRTRRARSSRRRSRRSSARSCCRVSTAPSASPRSKSCSPTPRSATSSARTRSTRFPTSSSQAAKRECAPSITTCSGCTTRARSRKTPYWATASMRTP